MTNPNEKAGPHYKAGPLEDVADSDSHLTAVRRRKAFARRLPPLTDGRRDPQFDLPTIASCSCGKVRPSDLTSSYGMTRAQLLAHGQKLAKAGWSEWEIRARLTDPREVAA